MILGLGNEWGCVDVDMERVTGTRNSTISKVPVELSLSMHIGTFDRNRIWHIPFSSVVAGHIHERGT